jgi:hypothetical protein
LQHFRAPGKPGQNPTDQSGRFVRQRDTTLSKSLAESLKRFLAGFESWLPRSDQPFDDLFHKEAADLSGDFDIVIAYIVLGIVAGIA